MLNKILKLTENELHYILRYSVGKLLREAKNEMNKGKKQTITSKKVTAPDNRTKFDKDADLKKALSYPTLNDLYHDFALTQRLRYWGLLDQVKEEFKKAGKSKGRGKRGPASKYPKWTVQSALEYASQFINGHELRENPEDPVKGRSCFHFLRNRDVEGNIVPTGDTTTPRLITLAFKEARKKDAENASILLANREERLQKEREQEKLEAPQRAAEKKAKRQRELELKRQWREKEKAAQKKQRETETAKAKKDKEEALKKEIAFYVANNNIESRMELFNKNKKYYLLANKFKMMEYLFGRRITAMAHRRAKTAMLNKCKTPSHLERRFPQFKEELRAPNSNLLKRRYPGWKLVNGQWVNTNKSNNP